MSTSITSKCHDALTTLLEEHTNETPSRVIFENLWRAPKAALISWLIEHHRCRVLLIASETSERDSLLQELAFFTPSPPLIFPSLDHANRSAALPPEDVGQVGQRMRVLSSLLEPGTGEIIVTDVGALMQPTYSPEALLLKLVVLRPGERISPHKLAEQLEEMGYRKTSLASEPGQFALRSGLIDLITPLAPVGHRIDFWGDEIETLRTFDPGDQRSTGKVDCLNVLPAGEQNARAEERGTLLDFLRDAQAGSLALVLDDLLELENQHVAHAGTDFKAAFAAGLGNLIEECKFTFYFLPSALHELTRIRRIPDKRTQVEFSAFGKDLVGSLPPPPFISLPQRFGSLVPELRDATLEAIERAREEGFSICIASANRADRDFAQKLLTTRNIDESAYQFVEGYLEEGFVVEASKLLLATTVSLTGHITLHRPHVVEHFRDPLEGDVELEIGEFVVHQHNGIGRFQGIEQTRNHQGENREFLKIEYADRAYHYVPLQQSHLIDKFIGTKDEVPRLHVLGSSKWKTLKSQTQSAIDAFANRLLEMHAERSLQQGLGFAPDSEQMRRFEEAFPYTLTLDQARAIDEIKAELQSQRYMDRLVCGDVGYGKTEVAMRAAFKTVVDGKRQVAILVPTTVLALQHFETFCNRMSSFPLRIAHLSRFSTLKESRETLKGLEEGAIDMVIGTHRLLGQNVRFRDLGLVVIDEEQRFGVRAKEHLRSLKSSAHCLTLSATPIPRTLYMSLVGTRDLSAINTPPQDRQQVSTIIAPMNDDLIKEALVRELQRGGQIFVIHNRIESLASFGEKLKQMVPQADVVVAHGQMSADEIDRVFHTFKKGAAQIMLATSIVENGIDIPNANTLIVDRSDTFGLADLHQLRGRVGRWNRRAYAYFLYPNLGVLPEISAKRLRALQETSGPGGGMKIAMRDLHIRGSGQILGVQQSGHVSAIGFHLYCKLLKKTLDALKGKRSMNSQDVKVEIACDARIPEKLIDDVSLRMHLYRRLGDCESDEEISAWETEMLDRFGDVPIPVQWLISVARIRCKAALWAFTSIKLAEVMGSDHLAHFYSERRTEKEIAAHHSNVTLPTSPKHLEDVLLKEMQQLVEIDQRVRQQRIAATLKKHPHARPRQSAPMPSGDSACRHPSH